VFRKSPTCFFVGPESGSPGIRGVVEQACASASVAVVPGSAAGEIADAIERADFVIADVWPDNPNILFELGIAYGMRKRILALTQATGELPSRLAGLRMLTYRPDDANKLTAYLRDWVSDMAEGRREAP
jgi:hypothetical protein